MKKIIIADDHEILREGLRELFDQDQEFQVVGTVDTGQKAVEQSRLFEADIVIMDLNMPEMNGIEATRIIKQERPETIVIALSMHRESNYVQEMLQAGADGYLLKDSAFSELRQAVDLALKGEVWLSPQISKQFVRGLGGDKGRKKLSAREKEVLKLLASGQSTKQAADALYVSVKTIEAHRSNIMNKLELRNLADLTRFAIRIGLIAP